MAMPFIGDRRGAVFVIFSLLLPVVLTSVLGLMSFSGFSSARADLQAASNAAANAVLADLNSALQVSATPDALVTDIDKKKRADIVVQSLLGSRSDLSSISTEVSTNADLITVTVSAEIENVTTGLFFAPFISASAKTTIVWSRADQLQIALAIDSGTSSLNQAPVQIRMPLIKLGLTTAITALSILPNYPDVALSVVPFTAQVATDPTRVAALETNSHDDFYDLLKDQFADVDDTLASWLVPAAYAGVTACYNAPLVPQGVDGSAFGGESRPMQNACETQIQRIRSLAKISRPLVNGKPVLSEPVNSPLKLARDDMINAINAISPAGCRNLAMGVTWSLAQLPNDNNPKVIFLIANGQNSRSAKGRTSECAGSGSPSNSVRAQLDKDFVASCEMVRDPMRNKGRQVDLLVLQAVDGNPVALKSCASSTDGVVNYFSTSTLSALTALFDTARSRLVQVAQRQQQKFKEKSLKERSGDDD